MHPAVLTISLRRSLALVALIGISGWILLSMQFGTVAAVAVLPDFLISVVTRLGYVPALLPSVAVVMLGLLLLILLSTLSAWLEVRTITPVWRWFSLILLFPSFAPVYVMSLAIEGHATESISVWVLAAPICVALGNGLWWWWHRQFVEGIRSIQANKANIGVANLGLNPYKFFVLPEFRLHVLRRIPEMFLWVAVNALFFEAAVPGRSGILYDLILSLSDGRRAVDWTGVLVAISFIGAGWLVCATVSENLVQKGMHYRSWLFIRGSLLSELSSEHERSRGGLLNVLIFTPLVLLIAITEIAQNNSVDYWELLFLLSVSSLLVFIFSLFSSATQVKDKALHAVGAWTSQRIAIVVVAMLVVVVSYQAIEIGQEFGLGAQESVAEADLEEEDLIYLGQIEESNQAGEDRFALIRDTFNLLGILALFVGGALSIYLLFVGGVFFFSFNALFSWQGKKRHWQIYRVIRSFLETASKVPPYLFLVLTVFWLGFQTFGGCSKQLVWAVALFLSLLPTQVLALYSAIEDAAESRFLTARKAIGNSAGQTFWFLISSHWSRVLPGLLTFAIGLAVLMDMSMIWLLDDRGTFTCNADHWLDTLRQDSLPSSGALLIWVFYPLMIYVCVYRQARGREVGST